MRWRSTAWVLVALVACNRSGPKPEKHSGRRPEPAAPVEPKKDPPKPPTVLDVPESEGATAFGVTRAGGLAWLSWLAPGDTGGHVLRTAALQAKLEPIRIIEGGDIKSNWADVPRVAAGADSMFAAWIVEPYEIRVSRSVDGGNSWSDPVAPHRGTATEFGFPLLLPEVGEGLTLAWLQDGTLQVGGLGHDGKIREPEVVDPRTCECCRVAGVNTAAGPLIGYRDRDDAEVRDISVARRTNDAWSISPSVADEWTIAGCPVNGPAMDASGDAIVMVRFSGKEPPGQVAASFSEDGGGTWKQGPRLDAGHPLGRVDVTWDGEDAIASWLEVDGEDAARANLMARRIRKDRSLGEPVKLADTVSSREAGFPAISVARGRLWWVWNQFEGDQSRLRASHAETSHVP